MFLNQPGDTLPRFWRRAVGCRPRAQLESTPMIALRGTNDKWSGREDSNLRPPTCGPEPGALPELNHAPKNQRFSRSSDSTHFKAAISERYAAPCPFASTRSRPSGISPRSQDTNFSGTSIVERRPWRTSAQSSNIFDCLISASVTGESRCSTNSRSTTDFGFSDRGVPATVPWRQHVRRYPSTVVDEDPVARLHVLDGAHGLGIRDAVPDSLFVSLQVVDRVDGWLGLSQVVADRGRVFHVGGPGTEVTGQLLAKCCFINSNKASRAQSVVQLQSGLLCAGKKVPTAAGTEEERCQW